MRRAVLTAALLLAACDSIEDTIGLDEPFTVQQGDFKRGPLPEGDGPAVTALMFGFGTLRSSARNAQVTGNAADTAYSVGIRLLDQGSGYWIRPVGSRDPIARTELTWSLPLEVSPEIEPGTHQLEVVAFDENGKPGPKRGLPVCVSSQVPDNGNVCNPKTQPPLLVASLTWNVDADVDLSVLAPDGVTYNRSKRSQTVNGKVLARLDADGVTGCLADGRRIENFVWNEAPLAGEWKIYANLFDACGKQSVSYSLTIHQRVDNGDGTFALEPIRTVDGDFLRLQANGGVGPALYVTSVSFSP